MNDPAQIDAVAYAGRPDEIDRFDPELFYRDHWRRRPLVLRGCGKTFLAPPLEWSDVEALEARLDGDTSGAGVHRRPDGSVLFVNQAQHTMPELAVSCTRLADLMGWEECTADLSVTRGSGAGIGCHFDHSDNFVVQQQGSKSWLVGLPEHTGRERQRKRMLETKGFVPSGRFPEPPWQVVLHPGDVLYLPLFAPHEGVEDPDGPAQGSVSVSFSYNARNALGSHLKPLLRALAAEDAWWQPLPLAGADPDRLEEALLRALRNVTRSAKGKT
ncbi:JmjC domain-containing protein [Streptomyces griseorubiginosus]|uniref:JmjC domain-containing protein n=1 Tax=Streptomyces griseorubiginosus TaxID=67304 RepID=UPI00345643EB